MLPRGIYVVLSLYIEACRYAYCLTAVHDPNAYREAWHQHLLIPSLST